MHWFRWANVFLIFLTLASYLSPVASPADFWPLSFLGLIYPWLLLANILFVVFWTFQGKWYALLSLGCILAGWGHVKSILGFNLPAEFGNETPVLRVLSLNCHGLRDRHNYDHFLKEEQITILLHGKDPDILCLQEFPTREEDAAPYVQFIQAHSELKYYYQEDGGLAVFSRFPPQKSQSRYFENRANGYQVVDLRVNGQDYRLFNVHLQSNAVTGLANRVAEKGNLQERETWRDLKGMLGRYRRSAKRRVQQAEELVKEVDNSPFPVILCGDFNDVPQSYVYRQLSGKMIDAFKERGAGLGMTYTGKIPGLRIDYILVSPSVKVLEYETGRAAFSDHRPVKGTLLLAP
jgi:endonuclease/exonuclease/phosphatase family metal-dependent hydrolase